MSQCWQAHLPARDVDRHHEWAHNSRELRGDDLLCAYRRLVSASTLHFLMNINEKFLGNGGDVVLDPLVAHCYSITFLVWLNARRSAGGANSIDTPTKRSRSQAHSQVRSSIWRPFCTMHLFPLV